MHAFLSNLAHRQTDRQTNVGARAKTYTSSVVGGKQEAMFRVCLYLASTVQYSERCFFIIITLASDLPMRTIKFCSVLFGLPVHR